MFRSSSALARRGLIFRSFTAKQTLRSHSSTIDYDVLKFPSKIPDKPTPPTQYKSHQENIDVDTLRLLERMSLVNIEDKEAVQVLEDSIEFASKILDIDTSGVQPMYTVLEHQNLRLREDIVTDGNCREQILCNASVTEDDYFVAPPGNIPLEYDSNYTFEDAPDAPANSGVDRDALDRRATGQ